MAFSLDGRCVSPALRGRRRFVADSQPLCWKRQGRVAGGDEPYADCVTGGDGWLEPLAGTAFARQEGVAVCLVCLADLPDFCRAGAVELSGVVERGVGALCIVAT